MKKIILISLVFFSAFVKAQVTIDPETFPQVSGAISDKYLYTNTGGEGKVKIKTIFDSVPILDTTSITYNDFYTLISGGNLQTGRTYILVDFQTIYDQMDFDASGALKSSLTTKTGAIEEIWVLALAPDRIASTAYSKTYPNDRIQYDWTYNATLVNGSPAKGRISERIDEWNNRTDYDHREIKFIRYDDGNGNFVQINDSGRTSQEFLTFGSNYGTGGTIYDNWLGDFYSIGAFFGQEYSNNVFNSNFVISNKTSSLFINNTFSGDVTFNTFSGNVDNNTFGGNVDNNTFGGNVQYNTFGGDVQYNTFGGDVYNNTFSGYVQNNTFIGDVYNNTFGGYVQNNTFIGDVYNNTFGGDVYDNTFGGNVQNNTFIGDVYNNTFSGYVQNNTFIGDVYNNTFGGNVQYNTFSGNVYNNTFSGNVDNNTFSGDVHNNTFSGYVDNNTFGGNVDNNTFSGNVDNNTFTFTSFLSYSDITGVISNKTIDETTYPFLFGTNYEKKILRASDNNVYARYFDGTNDINVLIP